MRTALLGALMLPISQLGLGANQIIDAVAQVLEEINRQLDINKRWLENLTRHLA